ncbi:AraC family transcriptional regulator [Pseudomonas sp. N040]|uniref:AraC family transcriptional regulator n=1 Tax=Pseudomonas sp. N040 TaxID=2785325 RepID=UPI0018A2BE46|nr:AraC family transcriptional regulator [Pseudomonas sp. N040]MBF7731417.1 AraC family transcriptional regulator ligand-binding domain-containing protein [Pseudomonas sp. N040]MBW7015061.1 AraC family transcriptional regulator [Pseudomonas sp. N040]
MPSHISAQPAGSLLYHAVYARLLCDVAKSHGLPVTEILREAGLDARRIDSSAQHIGHAEMNALIRAVQKRCDDPRLPFELGAKARSDVHGLPGIAMLCSRDLRQGLATLCQLSSLRSSQFRGQLSESDGEVRLDFRPVVPLHDVQEFICAALGLILAQLLASMLGDQHHQLRVGLPMDAPSCAATVAGWFPCPVRFNESALYLSLPLELLDLPCPAADAHTHAVALRQCALDQLGLQGDLASRLRAHLAGCQLEYPSLEDCARRLCLSPRSLSRALQQAGCSYQQLLDETRQEEALRLLTDTPLAVEQIAWQLGYADPSNFNRAFRRWQGCTPQAWRLQQTLRDD